MLAFIGKVEECEKKTQFDDGDRHAGWATGGRRSMLPRIPQQREDVV